MVCCVQYFKDTNREQFTTEQWCFTARRRLCSILQRYKSRAIHNPPSAMPGAFFAVFNTSKIQIESNSQLFPLRRLDEISCVQYFKDTNREQFTTCWYWRQRVYGLCSILQRYKSRAIHNWARYHKITQKAVFNTSKIQIESNSQPVSPHIDKQYRCVQYFKDTNREQFTTYICNFFLSPWLCSILQRYKSRAIHNPSSTLLGSNPAVFNTSKIQIESNSQPELDALLPYARCVQYFKDTNREQFTTYFAAI